MKSFFSLRVFFALYLSIYATLSLYAQLPKVYIQDFTHDRFAQTAKQYPRTDVNGNLYALVKVRTSDGSPISTDFKYNFYYLSNINDGQHDGEVWLYVAKDAKKIKITREGFAPLKEADLGMTIEAGETYVLTLSYVEPRMLVQKQWLKFSVSPSEANAIIQVRKAETKDNYEIWEEAARNLECGLYEYQIIADNYDMSEGRIMLNKANDTHTENVVLTPNFGYLQIDDSQGIAGAVIYVNNKRIGQIPYSSEDKWTAGEYTLQITNGELYKTYNSTFTIKKGETTTLAPRLESNAAETRIRVNADADIYIDKVRRGTREWSGPLKAGNYEVECRMDRHKSVVKTITVVADEPQDVLLDTPEPITGMLAVTSKPLDAEIRIDGELVGMTPMTVQNLIIGQHTVTVGLKNHKTEQRQVTIKEGLTENLSIELSDMAEMTIVSQPSGAELYLNGQQKGKTPYTELMPSGDYELKMLYPKYRDYTGTVHLDSSNPSLLIKMERQYQLPSCFYIQPTFLVGSYMAYGAEVGGYLANINVEGDFLMGATSQTLYWNYVGGTNNKRPVEESFTSSYYGAKVGYGLCFGNRFRLTPQVGAGCLSVKGKQQTNAYAIIASAGARADYALTSFLGVNVTPEVGFGVSESSVFSELSSVSSDIKGWATGFNLKVGVYFCF